MATLGPVADSDPDSTERSELVGRRDEVELLAAMLDQARSGRSSVVVLEGEPGIGKSTLLDHVVHLATGCIVARARAAQSEYTLEYGLLGQLVSTLAGWGDKLADSHRAVVASIGDADHDRAAAIGDRFAVGAAVLALASMAAESAPVVLLVDDAQWADAPSLDALGFMARRVLADRIVLIVARRPVDEPSALDGLPNWQLQGLGADEVHELLARHHPALDPDQVARVVALTAGNPLALTDLPRDLGVDLGPQLESHSPWPVSRRIEAAYGARLAHLPAPSRRALLAVAVLEAPDGLQLATAFERLGIGFEALAAAEREGLVRLTAGTVQFRHPLVRAVVIQMADPDDRRHTERVAAEVLATSTSALDATRRAWHLAAAAMGPDEVAAEALEQAARRAETAGGYATAIHAWERAGQLSRDAAVRRTRFVAGAEAAYQAGQQSRALALLAQADRVPGSEVSEAEVARIRGRIEIASGRPDNAYETLVAVASHIDEPRLAVQLLFDAVFAAGFLGAPHQMLTASREATRRCTYDDPVHQLIARLSQAAALTFLGRADEAMPLMDADDLLIAAVGSSVDVLAYANAVGFCRLMMGMLPQAERLIDAVLESATRHGATVALPLALALRADIDFRRGAWASAIARATQSIDVSSSTGRSTDLATAHNVLASVAAAQGRREECLASAEACLTLSRTNRSHATETGGHGALGLLELGLGRPAEALVHLAAAERVCRDHKLLELAHFEWAAETVEAHVRAGHRHLAEPAREAFEWHADRTPRPIVVGLSERCEGLLADDADMDAHFERSVSALTEALQPFELARTHLCFGERLRRARRRADARVHLESALRAFTALGATPWATRTRAELEATGVRTAPQRGRITDALTQQELQIATLVAGGLGNVDVAAQLFLSRKTVEYHLSSIYRKLQVSTRHQLAEAMATELSPA